jgi:hypothetical protein
MNKLQKDIVFYSNYCLHCNNLLNKLSKTTLHNKILYICVDDQKIKIPKIVSRVPSLYIVNDKRVLIENEIDIWVNSQIALFNNKNKQTELQKPISHQVTNIESMSPHPSHDHTQHNIEQPPVNTQPPHNNQEAQSPPHNNQEAQPDGDILAYHGNEMGSTLSNNYSFLEETDNSSLNHNFTFVGESNIQSINTPKEFTDSNNQIKSELDQQYEKMMEARNSDSMSKGIQRI